MISIIYNILNLNSLSSNKITSKGASLLFNTLKECKSSVETISLYINELDDDCMKSFGEFIQNNNTVKNIIIGDNKITDKGIEILPPYLIGNITINELNVKGNKGITDKSVPLLIEIIQKSIIEDIRETSITNKNIIVVPLIENKLKNGSDKIYMSDR